MIPSLPQSVLFLILCPLLVAQQVTTSAVTSDAPQPSLPAPLTTAPHSLPEFITIPKDKKIELVQLDSVSPSKSKRGDVIRYAVEEEVVVDGIVILHAGSIVLGVVTKATKAVPGKRDGDIDFEPRALEIGGHHKLHLTSSPPSPPKTRAERKDAVGKAVGIIVTAPLWIPIFPIFAVVYSIADWDNSGGPPEGKNAEINFCGFELPWYTKSATTVRVADLNPGRSNAAAATVPCTLAN
jgi:hypothetical protein